MASGYKRLSRKARHLIHHLKRSKHASVQNTMVHELQHEINRHWGSRRQPRRHNPGNAGQWRPLTRRAKQLLTRLRKTKVWSVQKQLVREIIREIERGKRLAERIRKARPVRTGRRVARASGRAARAAGRKARPHLERAGRATAARTRTAASAVKSRWARARLARQRRRHPFGPPQRPAGQPRPARAPRQRPVRQGGPIRRAPRVRARRAPRVRARA